MQLYLLDLHSGKHKRASLKCFYSKNIYIIIALFLNFAECMYFLMTSSLPAVPRELSPSAWISYLIPRTKLVHNLRFMQIKMNRFATCSLCSTLCWILKLKINIIVSVSRVPKVLLNDCQIFSCSYNSRSLMSRYVRNLFCHTRFRNL